MHRLLSARNVYQSGFHGVSIPSSNALKNNNIPEIKCSFCRKLLIGRQNSENLTVRCQSTKTVSALRSLRKKSKYKNYKKYGELLAVGEKAMTETKVSISKLKAAHLSKLASSPLSLGQLHQLNIKNGKRSPVEVDTELLQSVREKLLKKPSPVIMHQMAIEDDKCTLVYTSHQLTNIEDRIKTKQYLDMVKESYYNFRKATLYNQKLQDLRYAINEGLTQEFDHESSSSNIVDDGSERQLPKSPHAVFRELFIDNQLDSFDQELMTHITKMQAQGVAHPAMDDICEDTALHEEIAETRDDLEFDHDTSEQVHAKGLKIKKAQQAIKQKKRAKREKRRVLRESNMKHNMKELERRGKQEALHRLLEAHLQLLCSLQMIHEGRKIVQYYRQKSKKVPDHPKVTDLKVFNILLHGYAGMGLLKGAKDILSYMAEDGIEPNAQTFAAIFECIERSDAENKLSLFNHYHEIMQKKNIALNDLLDKAKFQYDQRETVLKAIRQLDPSFEPQYTSPVLNYDCPLLNRLNNELNRRGLKQSPAEGLLTLEEIIAMGQKQFEIELDGEIKVKNIDSRDEQSESVKFCRQKLKEIESEWRGVIKDAFIRNLGTLKSQSLASHSAITLYPYFKVLHVDQFVDLIMGELYKLVDGSETYSPMLKLLQRDLGTLVYEKYQIEQYRSNGILEKVSAVYTKYCEWYIKRDGPPQNGRQAWQSLVQQFTTGPSLDMEDTPWPMDLRQNIGKFLYNIIINDVKIDVNMFKTKAKVKKLPAVYKVHRPWGRLLRLELKPHPVLARAWGGAAAAALRVRASLAPAAAPPAPWRAPRAGGYLLTPTSLIR